MVGKVGHDDNPDCIPYLTVDGLCYSECALPRGCSTIVRIDAKNGLTRLIVACLVATALQACESTSLGLTQIGGLPRPGLFTSFSLPDTANLEPSRDPAADRRPFPKRGIVYTRRAGFIDLAHVFNTAVLENEATKTIEAALRENRKVIQLRESDRSRVTLTLEGASPDSEQGIRAEARAAGACVLYDLMTWHEIITWFGYKSTYVWTEKPSAFTYEDTVSNLVGVDVFERIPGEATPSKLGAALRDELNDLGLVDKRVAARAVHSVKGTWWGPRLYTRRMVDIGQNGAPINPWLVPGTSKDVLHDERGPVAFTDPCTEMPGAYSLRIVPTYWTLHRIRWSAPATPRVIDASTDFDALMDVIATQVKQELGADATSPD
jgi:hypothetical protein